MSAVREYTTSALKFLQQLIAIPSPSGSENLTADAIENFLQSNQVKVHRKGNNVWACSKTSVENPLRILLNSHHDTVKPNPGYRRNPYDAAVEEGKLYGLGSNDAGASLVGLLFAFLHFDRVNNLPFELIFAATAEEEISGNNGIQSIVKDFSPIDFAIVGEPTEMQLAVAEKGLMVLDCRTTGTASHAAHPEPDNAIYHAMKDIEWFRDFQFPETSEFLGKVNMNVTEIHAGTQHNVVPAECRFVVDIRSNGLYSNEELMNIIHDSVSCTIQPRSTRLNSSSIPLAHPLVKAAIRCGCHPFGSHTLSDQALLPFPSVKIGPGNTLRSHMADEYVFVQELHDGIEKYIDILNELAKS